jgi:hypothetical protein
VNKRVAKKIVKRASPERYVAFRVLSAVSYLWRRLPTVQIEDRWLFRKGGKYGRRSRIGVPEALQQTQDDVLFGRHEWYRPEDHA